MNISKSFLENLYIQQSLSSAQISEMLRCSENKINYWMRKYQIPKRTISDAIYIKRNPNGDPFSFKKPSSFNEAFLFGLGLGLYWGEGTKSNKLSVRLGNTDPRLIIMFLEFLKKIYNINIAKLRFGLQVFNDMNPQRALAFWKKYLNMPASQFHKLVVTPSRGVGTYRQKTKYGVLTVYYCNKKLRDHICRSIEEICI